MAMLTGTVKYARVMDGEYKSGKRQGQRWEFLSMEIIDPVTGFTWACQLPSEDSTYRDASGADLTGHKVRVKVTSQTAGPRTKPDGTQVMQIRSQVRRLEDLGEFELSE